MLKLKCCIYKIQVTFNSFLWKIKIAFPENYCDIQDAVREDTDKKKCWDL